VGAVLLKLKAFCGTPFDAGTHGPATFVAVCKTKFVPDAAGQRTKICPPTVLAVLLGWRLAQYWQRPKPAPATVPEVKQG